MDLAALSDEELIDEVTTWAGRVAAGEARLLELVGELDAREAWAVHGVRSCAHWLTWQLGLSLTTAHEKVRVARALRALPVTCAAMSAGQLSYAQVRAVTRIATPGDEHRWVDLARHCTGAQLDRAARGAARARAADHPAEQRPVKNPVSIRWDDDGDLVLTLRLPAHQAVGVLAALEQHQTAEQTDRDALLAALGAELTKGPDSSAEESAVPEPYVYVEPTYPIAPERLGHGLTPADHEAITAWEIERDRRRVLRDAWREHEERVQAEAHARELPTGRATLADALVRALVGPHPAHHAPAPVTNAKVQLLVDPVSGWARTRGDELLPPSTMKAVLRTLPGRHRIPTIRPLTQADLTRHDQGRRSRVVSPALRALLGQLDGERCRFPGCQHTRHLHAHHVLFWRHGGLTDLSNLILLCSHHHRYLHDNGYQLTLHPDRTLTVRTPCGTVLEHHREAEQSSAEDLPHAQPDTLPSRWKGEGMDLGYVVNVLLQHAA